MLSYLADFDSVFGPLRLFRYITLRGVLAAATALLFGFMIGPPILLRLRRFKISQIIREEGEVGELAKLHASKKNTPTMGGLMIYGSIVVSTLLWAKPNVYILVTLLVYTGLTAVGFTDDYLKVTRKSSRGLASRYKLGAQAAITVFALVILLNHAGAGSLIKQLWIPFFKYPVIETMPLWFLVIFFFLVLSGASNAINLTDGIDGLAIGCTITVALVYGIMAYASGHLLIAEYLIISYVAGSGELAVVCATIVGASLAFLWFNAHPAEVFMGDTGSLALGGLIGTIALLIHQPITLILVGGIFVIEAASVILQVASFKTRGKRVFRMAPIHHHFELLGWAESKVVVRFWILSFIFAVSGLATLKLR